MGSLEVGIRSSDERGKSGGIRSVIIGYYLVTSYRKSELARECSPWTRDDLFLYDFGLFLLQLSTAVLQPQEEGRVLVPGLLERRL